MADKNHLTLAVAGSGKTQSIVNACVNADPDERILILTYTSANQQQLRDRLATAAGDHHNIEVSGWFTFLIGHFVRPYLPFAYRGRRVRGFDFDSKPQRYARSESWARYFNNDDWVRKVHLAQLTHRVNEAADNRPIRRLERIYDRVFVDEVQDLCGWDLEILLLLMSSRVSLELVGDVRQAIILTNPQEQKNSSFKFMKIWDWFRIQERQGSLTIGQACNTYRCRPEIAALADSLFPSQQGFDSTVSQNVTVTDHDGLFLVGSGDADAYIRTYAPLFLRWSKASGKQFGHLGPMNFGESKGLERDHVLIYPTKKIRDLLQRGEQLEENAAAYLYVAVTRARQSEVFSPERWPCPTRSRVTQGLGKVV